MRLVEINMMSDGSTGKIMFQIADTARKNNIEVKTFSPIVFSRKKHNKTPIPNGHTVFGTFLENGFHYYAGVLLGRNGYFSVFGTWQLVNELKKFKPDIIHLHNIHSFCINIPILFKYIRKNGIKVIWTLHDCWSFTGHCPYFSMTKCEKWKTGCYNCPQPLIYPKMYADGSRKMYKDKKKIFTDVGSMVIVTPSEWLANLAKESFLKKYPVKVINNGIDLSVFKPTENNFRNKYGIGENQFVLLGVAFGWGKRKGLDVFVELSKRLDKAKYRIVLVGTDENTDKQLPDNIISIHKTQNQKELAEIYSAADLFVNPTREENYPTVNMEAIACGTPVITFRTGGSPEILDDTCGTVVECDDIDAMEAEIRRICETKPFSREDCLKHAKSFDMNLRFEEYINLYKEVMAKK